MTEPKNPDLAAAQNALSSLNADLDAAMADGSAGKMARTAITVHHELSTLYRGTEDLRSANPEFDVTIKATMKRLMEDFFNLKYDDRA